MTTQTSPKLTRPTQTRPPRRREQIIEMAMTSAAAIAGTALQPSVDSLRSHLVAMLQTWLS